MREVREITVFDVVKQLELDNFCDLMFGAVKDIGSQEGLKEALQTEITEKELQQINVAALQEGYPLIHKINRIPQNRNTGQERCTTGKA